MLWNSRVAAQLAASPEWLESMESVSQWDSVEELVKKFKQNKI
jgi:hypothetical protein